MRILVFNGRDGEWQARARGGRQARRHAARRRAGSPAGGRARHRLPVRAAEARAARLPGAEGDRDGRRPPAARAHPPHHARAGQHRAHARQCHRGGRAMRHPAHPRGAASPRSSSASVAGWDAARPLIFCDEGSEERCPFTTLARLQPGPLALLIGPEGGFDEAERELLSSKPFVTRISLGPAHPARRHRRRRRSRPRERGARRLALDRRRAGMACADAAFQLTRGATASAIAATLPPPTRTVSPMSTRQDSAPAPTVRSRDDLIAWIAAGSKPAQRVAHRHRAREVPVPHRHAAARALRGPARRARADGRADRPLRLAADHGGRQHHRPQAARGRGRAAPCRSSPAASSSCPARRSRPCTRSAPRRTSISTRCCAAGAPLRIGFLGVGFSPNWTLDETPRMPKQRYQVMTRYMPMVGKRGLDMMYRTATIQVNLDFADEADMVKKFRVSLALQPVATAIFACSPFTEGKPNGFLSMRSEVWRDTDTATHGHAALRVRARHELRALRRLRARRADVFRLPRRPLHRRRRRLVPRLPRRQACHSCRANSRPRTIGRTISPRCFPRCA